MRIGWKTAVVASALAVGATAVAGTALAGTDDKTIDACAAKTNGTLRVSEHCRKSEVRVSWNRRGPVGPQGPVGPAGPAGPANLDVTLRQVTRTITVPPMASELPDDPTVGVASICASGETVLSGGLTGWGPELLGLETVTTGPTFDGNRSGWLISYLNRGSEPVTMTVRMSALCTAGSMTASG